MYMAVSILFSYPELLAGNQPPPNPRASLPPSLAPNSVYLNASLAGIGRAQPS